MATPSSSALKKRAANDASKGSFAQERFVVADDPSLFCDGLARLLGQLWPVAQVKQAGNPQQALAIPRRGPPSIGLVLDVLYP